MFQGHKLCSVIHFLFGVVVALNLLFVFSIGIFHLQQEKTFFYVAFQKLIFHKLKELDQYLYFSQTVYPNTSIHTSYFHAYHLVTPQHQVGADAGK